MPLVFRYEYGGKILAFKQLTGRGDRRAKTAIEMTLYFMRGLAMERIFRQNDAHYDGLIARWKEGLRAGLG